ncbi:MAG: CinA family nicotinamide mononucleotide deamidase-related protein, partial [Proteobacteria bacterium]|nr:CinA family nicotinamide mononucleotide deamidase-related protein [Pseudomonadota bacterium]
MNKPNASLLLTGDELVHGDVVDTNSVKISGGLVELGFEIQQKRVVGDELERIVNAILELSSNSQVLIINGGLGSTIDDLGAEAGSIAAEKPLRENTEAKKHIDQIFNKVGKIPDDLQYRQALVPEGAKILPNPVGSAVGFKLIINQCHCYFTPGVPREMEVMLIQSILPDIINHFPVENVLDLERVLVFGLGELEVQRKIYSHFPDRLWDTIKLGFRTNPPYIEIKLSCNDRTEPMTFKNTVEQVRKLFQNFAFSQGPLMGETLSELLHGRKETIALAESCTGGMIASEITKMPGASIVFQAGIVTYSNLAKEQILGVPEELIRLHGAVSRQVADSMVKNIIVKSQSDYGIAVTGIAGPSGGTEVKPVGTVYIGLGSKNRIFLKKLII